MSVKHPHIQVQLSGQDGNVFNILGLCSEPQNGLACHKKTSMPSTRKPCPATSTRLWPPVKLGLTFPDRATSSPLRPVKSSHRLTITSTYFGSSSTIRHWRPSFSQAISVDDPPKQSIYRATCWNSSTPVRSAPQASAVVFFEGFLTGHTLP